MAPYTKSDDFLGGVFTLQNGVRKNNGPHGGNWPPLGPQWGPMGHPMGPHGGPNGGPNIWTMGGFSPMGAPMTNYGGSNMPMGEINGHHADLCTVLSYKTSGSIAFPHGVKRYTKMDNSVCEYCCITYREGRLIEGWATFNFRCWPETVSGQ